MKIKKILHPFQIIVNQMFKIFMDLNSEAIDIARLDLLIKPGFELLLPSLHHFTQFTIIMHTETKEKVLVNKTMIHPGFNIYIIRKYN